MTIYEPYIYYSLLGGKALVLILAALMLLRMWRQSRRVEQYLTRSLARDANARLSHDDAKQQLLLNLRLDKRLTEIQRQLSGLSVKEPGASVPVERYLPIENATRMARHGASVEELTRACGLNIGEARLLQKLHGKKNASTHH